jgi:hypothetical protein
MSKPDYRFLCHIVDQATGEVVISASTFLSTISSSGECESVDMEVGSMLRAFGQKVRDKYEAENHPSRAKRRSGDGRRNNYGNYRTRHRTGRSSSIGVAVLHPLHGGR